MKVSQVLNKTLEGNYTGYQPSGIWEYIEKPFAWDACKSLQRIPKKISYFFNKELIKEIKKSDCFKDPLDNYYLVKLIDNTYLEIEY